MEIVKTNADAGALLKSWGIHLRRLAPNPLFAPTLTKTMSILKIFMDLADSFWSEISERVKILDTV